MVICSSSKRHKRKKWLRTITIEIIRAAKKYTYTHELKEANTCMVQIHVANDDDDEQSLVHKTFTYERNKSKY